MEDKNMVLFALSSSQKLASEISNLLQIPLGKIFLNRFEDGEILVRPQTSVRQKDVFVIQSTNSPINENLMELLIFVDALKRASANSINAIIPYYGYARQDRKAHGREPITAKLVANLLEVAGVNRVELFDLHAEQIQGFFDIPVDDLKGYPMLLEGLINHERLDLSKIVIVSPDHGGVKRARKIADRINCPLAIVDKRRPRPNYSEAVNILGDVVGKQAIIIDDMIDTGGTIIASAKKIKEAGAESVFIMVTHPVFSGTATTKLASAIKSGKINKIYVSNTIELPPEKRFKGLEIVSVAPFVAKIIKAIIDHKSISVVYDKYLR